MDGAVVVQMLHQSPLLEATQKSKDTKKINKNCSYLSQEHVGKGKKKQNKIK